MNEYIYVCVDRTNQLQVKMITLACRAHALSPRFSSRLIKELTVLVFGKGKREGLQVHMPCIHTRIHPVSKYSNLREIQVQKMRGEAR